MSLEIDVLRALLRLSRRRTTPTLAEVRLRVPADDAALERVLAALARAGLIHAVDSPRLTLPGFAVAVAAAAPRPTSRASASASAGRNVSRLPAAGLVARAPSSSTRRRRAA